MFFVKPNGQNKEQSYTLIVALVQILRQKLV